jgi:hypothetical protein
LKGVVVDSFSLETCGRHQLDLGDIGAARAFGDRGLNTVNMFWYDMAPLFHALLARIDLAEGLDVTARRQASRLDSAQR